MTRRRVAMIIVVTMGLSVAYAAAVLLGPPLAGYGQRDLP